MESLIENGLDADEMHFNNHNIPSLTPELQFSPLLAKLFFQQNNNLTTLPPSFFQKMPVLQVLNLSGTNIQSLPPSIFKLRLLKEFILQEFSLLVEVPPGIGELKNLKLFDLEGTEIMYLPKEIGKLQTLELLRVSLSTYADDHKDRNCIEHIIPRMTISKLTKLKELSISVSPEAEWWEVELLEAIMGDLLFLPDLKTLKLYLPTAKSLQRFLSLERNQVSIYSSLWDYRLLTGHCEQLPFSVQLDAEENFQKLEKCVKYMNGEGYTDEIAELIRNARALYLRRHWTIEHLPVSDMRKMKYCMLMECNEMKTVVHQDELCGGKNKAANTGEDEVLGSLQYLAIHFMKKLQSILKGPISRNGLSSLRILALHSCPELTTIFTEFLLANLQSLTEIVVEDCPKVNCLVNLEEGTPWAKGPFLPNLRKISLLDLPELVSISASICIAPQLDTLIVFNCMRLNYLSVMELPRGIKAIKGEIEWWDALIYGKLTWNTVFVQLKRDGVLMDQLAEDTNSLQHFLELKMVPSLPVNQNSSRDTKEDMEHQLQIIHNDTQSVCAGTAFTRWEPPCPASGKPDVKVPNNKLVPTKKNCRSTDIAKWIHLEKRGLDIGCQVSSDNVWKKNSQNESCNYKYPRNIKITTSKYLAKVNEGALDDGYSWRKYGEKLILGAKYPRSYYRCSFRITYGCIANKTVQRSIEDPSTFEVNYRGKHTCPPPLSSDCFSTKTELACRFLRTQDSSAETESASTITHSHFEPVEPQVLDINKKNIKITTLKYLAKVNAGALDDGYSWRKCGEKSILGAKYPRLYYRCSFKFIHDCHATKSVERSTKDPSIFEVNYKGKHTCAPPLSNDCFSTETDLACRVLRAQNLSAETESASTITDSHSELVKPQVLDFNMKKSSSVRDTEWTQQMTVSLKTGSDMPPDDGYMWRKYGQKEVFEAKYPRSYYKCSSRDCIARKQVQRSDDDPPIWEITYERLHTCLRLSVTSDSADKTESALGIVKNSNSSSATDSELRILRTSGSSSTAESISTITDNSSGLDSMGKMSGSASIQRWKQQTKEIRTSFYPSLKQQLTSSSITSEPNMIISEIEENSSRNLPSSLETPQNTEKHPPILETYQARKKTLGDRITELHQLVSPFGKTDTASVLLETRDYITFLHEQVNALTAPYTIQGTPFEPKQQTPKQDLRSRGLCLVPVSSTFPVTNQITINSSTPVFGERPDEPNKDIYKDEQLLSVKNKCHNQNNNDTKSRLGRVQGSWDVDKSYLYRG